MPILGSSNSASNKDMMVKYGQTGTQFSAWVENISGKGEIARYKQISWTINPLSHNPDI